MQQISYEAVEVDLGDLDDVSGGGVFLVVAYVIAVGSAMGAAYAAGEAVGSIARNAGL